MRLSYFVILFCGLLRSTHSDVSQPKTEDELRSKRQINTLPLVYPYGSTFKFIVGISAPIPNKDHISMAFAANFQFQYIQFQNISQLSRYYYINEISREQRDADLSHRRGERLFFYRSFANLLDSKGLNGADCVLRAICEAAQYPVEEEGLFGEIIHILLTPDYGSTAFNDEDPEWEESITVYKDAAIAGRQMFDCAHVYSGCPQGQGVMELMSVLRDE